jgi:hypothetical protein
MADIIDGVNLGGNVRYVYFGETALFRAIFQHARVRLLMAQSIKY